MPALAKPHRIAFLVPDVSIDGPDAPFERAAAALLWTACIEACQRHPRLAVLDPDATPLLPQDGQFVPKHAERGGRPNDAFFAPTRRDEVLWLELSLSGKPAAVRLHVVGRDGTQESFDALGRNIGSQIDQVLAAWLTARGLGALPRRFEPATSDELLAVVRVVGPVLAEQARAWALPVATKPTWSLSVVADSLDESLDDSLDLEDDVSIDVTVDSTLDTPIEATTGRSIARPVANRLPAQMRVSALRLLELALREDLSELVLAVDPEHPQALFGKFEAAAPHRRDYALLRRVIASAPGWARPHEELDAADDASAAETFAEGVGAPSALETTAAAAIAALCRPAALPVLVASAERLDAAARTDEALRLLERAVALMPDDPRAHVALLDLYEHADREGAQLEQALRSSSSHGCPMDPVLPWYPDQIQIDLRASTALLDVGRLDEAIALRANRLDGRETAWAAQARVLGDWRKDPRFVAWSYAREGYFRGDEARAVEGFGRVEPGDSIDLAIFLDSLVALGRENEVAFAWAQFGLGRGLSQSVARLAAARGLFAAGQWRDGLEQLWRVELGDPGRDEHVAIARALRTVEAVSADGFITVEAAIAERLDAGATSLARRMARDLADFVPVAANSSVVARALGKATAIAFDPAWLAGFSPATPSRRAIDALFADVGVARKDADARSELARGDRLVGRWLEVVFAEASEDDRAALAQAAAYTAAQALARYFAATTAGPTLLAGALRTVAGEALALVARHRHALGDREARALCGAIDPALRRIDRWIGTQWLGAVERAVGLDERSNGDVVEFVAQHPIVAARILGPEEVAVLGWSIARLFRERPDGWASAVAAQAERLATHTGGTGVDEWADAVVEQLATKTVELTDAIDALATASYLARGDSALPGIRAARVLLTAGRGEPALAMLCDAFPDADVITRDRELAPLANLWSAAGINVPFEFDRAAEETSAAVQAGAPARAVQLGRWAVACDPDNAEAHRNLGLAFAQQGMVPDAIHHLVRATRDQALQLTSGVLYQSGRLVEAMAVLAYASRWYVRADQWLAYGGIAYGAGDNAQTTAAYKRAYQLDPKAFDATQLNAYAGVLDEIGDYKTCEKIANELLRVGGDDVMWQCNAWHHLACAYLGQGRFPEALDYAQRAMNQNPAPDNADVFAATLTRAQEQSPPMPPPPPAGEQREVVFAELEAGNHNAAALRSRDPSWRVRRAALHAIRFRFASENQVDVATRARASAVAVIGDTTGATELDALLARALAMQIREHAYFAREPVPRLGDRMTRDAFYQEFRSRGGIVLGDNAPSRPSFVDRVVVPGGAVARVSDYVALLRDLAALTPKEALAQFDLDDAGYLDVAKAWAAALDADATLAATIAAGLAKR